MTCQLQEPRCHRELGVSDCILVQRVFPGDLRRSACHASRLMFPSTLSPLVLLLKEEEWIHLIMVTNDPISCVFFVPNSSGETAVRRENVHVLIIMDQCGWFSCCGVFVLIHPEWKRERWSLWVYWLWAAYDCNVRGKAWCMTEFNLFKGIFISFISFARNLLLLILILASRDRDIMQWVYTQNDDLFSVHSRSLMIWLLYFLFCSRMVRCVCATKDKSQSVIPPDDHHEF